MGGKTCGYAAEKKRKFPGRWNPSGNPDGQAQPSPGRRRRAPSMMMNAMNFQGFQRFYANGPKGKGMEAQPGPGYKHAVELRGLFLKPHVKAEPAKPTERNQLALAFGAIALRA